MTCGCSMILKVFYFGISKSEKKVENTELLFLVLAYKKIK